MPISPGRCGSRYRGGFDETFGLQRVQQSQQGGAFDAQRPYRLRHCAHPFALSDVAQQAGGTSHRGREVFFKHTTEVR